MTTLTPSVPLPAIVGRVAGGAGKGQDTMNPTTVSTIRAIIRLAIQERRRRDSFPPGSTTSIRANVAYHAFLLAAWTVAFQAKP